MTEMSAQAIGLIAGVMVFCTTVVVTFLLLVFGGSFRRMREQVIGILLCRTAAAVRVTAY